MGPCEADRELGGRGEEESHETPFLEPVAAEPGNASPHPHPLISNLQAQLYPLPLYPPLTPSSECSRVIRAQTLTSPTLWFPERETEAQKGPKTCLRSFCLMRLTPEQEPAYLAEKHSLYQTRAEFSTGVLCGPKKVKTY